MTGIKLGFAGEELYDLALGAVLHDVGKLMVPKEILHIKNIMNVGMD